jgi:3-oxoacyl-[acyl-carrier protein] reductase
VPLGVVTGASRGIGRAIALELGRQGFSLGLVARSESRLQDVQEELARIGVRATAAVADVTDAEAVDDAVATIAEAFGPIDLVVNNAGSLRAIGPVWLVDPQDWWADVNTSIGGAFNFCRAVVPEMIERRRGCIVNITSYAAVRAAPYESGYGCGKAGLASLTESLAVSLEDYGVKVFSFAPGFTDTDMTRGLAESEEGRRWLPGVAGREAVSAEHAARVVASLASGRADALNGRFIHSLDDLDALVAGAETIKREDLYAPRVRRLPTS